MPKFEIGDTVAWEPGVAALHAEGSIIRADALPSAPVGQIIEYANGAKTWYTVEFPEEALSHPAVQEASGTHPDKNRLVLTQDELVKVKIADQSAPAQEGEPHVFSYAKMQAEMDRIAALPEAERAAEFALMQDEQGS